jgi:hypothetical protein
MQFVFCVFVLTVSLVSDLFLCVFVSSVFVPSVFVCCAFIACLFLTVLYHAERREGVKPCYGWSWSGYGWVKVPLCSVMVRIWFGLAQERVNLVQWGRLCLSQIVLKPETFIVRDSTGAEVFTGKKFIPRARRISRSFHNGRGMSSSESPPVFREKLCLSKNTNRCTGGSVVFHNSNSSLYKKKHQNVQSKTDGVATGANALRLKANC